MYYKCILRMVAAEMSVYLLFKFIHVTTAVITATLFATRLALDAAGRPGWRDTALRFIPHINDTLLLAAAIGLCVVTGWYPFIQGLDWLTAKVLLLCFYIVCGKLALDRGYAASRRALAAAVALLTLAVIFAHALYKPY